MTQTVTEPEDEATPSSEEKGEQKLETLLDEFEEGTQPEPKPDETESDDIASLKAQVQSLVEERSKERTSAGITEAIKVVKGEMALPDEVFEGLIYSRAEKDPRFLKAFQNRSEHPGQWNKVLTALGTEFSASLESLPDRNLTEARDAMRVSVRNQSTGPEDTGDRAKEIQTMSSEDWRAKRHEFMG